MGRRYWYMVPPRTAAANTTRNVAVVHDGACARGAYSPQSQVAARTPMHVLRQVFSVFRGPMKDLHGTCGTHFLLRKDADEVQRPRPMPCRTHACSGPTQQSSSETARRTQRYAPLAVICEDTVCLVHSLKLLLRLRVLCEIRVVLLAELWATHEQGLPPVYARRAIVPCNSSSSPLSAAC